MSTVFATACEDRQQFRVPLNVIPRDTDVLLDVSRNSQGAIACLDGLGIDWALSAMATLELISRAKNQRDVDLIGRLDEVYERSQ